MAEREYRSECKTCGKSGYLLLREQPATTFVRCPHCGSEALATALLPPPRPQKTGEETAVRRPGHAHGGH